METILGNSSVKKEDLERFFLRMSGENPIDENFILEILRAEEIPLNLEVILEKIANKFLERKNFEISFKIYKKLSIFSDHYLGKTIELAFSQGDLFLAELAGKKYLKYLAKEKTLKCVLF